MKKTTTVVAGMLCLATMSKAQSASSTQTLNLTLVNAISIVFTGSGTSTGSSVSLPFTTIANYSNGVTSSAQQLMVQSNKGFTVTVNSNSTNFTYSGSTSPAPTMPVNGVLKLEVTANSTGGTIASPFSSSSYASLSSSAQNLLINCSNGGNQTFSVQYQAMPGFSYPSGTYSTSVVYTATQL
jgi:hypothetical protein